MPEILQVQDRIYGPHTFEHPIFAELDKTAAVRRTKGLGQQGIPDRYYHVLNFSRYEHGVGVAILLAKHGASDEEQVAGFLHDVSHYAHSHIVDWVNEDGSNQSNQEDSQDQRHRQFVLDSDVPPVLAKHGFEVERIVDHHNFGLLERPAPDLCADRIDYALRELPQSIRRPILEGLTVAGGEFVFGNKTSAKLFGERYSGLQSNHWGSYEAVARYYLFSEVLKKGLAEGILSESDLDTTDDEVMAKISDCTDPEIIRSLKFLRQKPLPQVGSKPGIVKRKKFRWVDPKFMKGDRLVRLSETSHYYKFLLEQGLRENKQGVVVPRFETLT